MSIRDTLRKAIDLAYPEHWLPDRLSLPIPLTESQSTLTFEVMCSALPEIERGKRFWPPTSHEPDIWIQFVSENGSLWLRPRRSQPIVRERLILLEPHQFDESSQSRTIQEKGLLTACRFATLSQHVVWCNPAKGGSRQPKCAHLQSMPLRIDDGHIRRVSIPCCSCDFANPPWHGALGLKSKLLSHDEYPVLGAVVWGPVSSVPKVTWAIINEYSVDASNLIIQPSEGKEGTLRTFIFPRSRHENNAVVTATDLKPNETVLLENSRDDFDEWSFASPEMGLLTQAVWPGVFNEMKMKQIEWGRTYDRLLKRVTLKESDDDWRDFSDIVSRQVQM